MAKTPSKQSAKKAAPAKKVRRDDDGIHPLTSELATELTKIGR
jgi:hypothetical protein